VRHRGGGGNGVGGRGARCRRMRRSPAGRCGAEEAGVLMGGGGRGARRWWGDARCSRKRCSPTREAWGGGDGHDVGQCEVGWRGVGMHGVRSHGVDRAA
jgi:hypothetical protein